MDNETKKVLSVKEKMRDLVGHEGWPLVRSIFSEKILDLQNAFNLEFTDPQSMFIDLKARMLASQILFDLLREIEGSAQEAVENKQFIDKGYIVKND